MTSSRGQLPPDLSTAARLMHEGRTQDAAAQCQTYLKRHKRDVEAHHLLGLVRTMEGRYADAVKSFERALKVERDAHHVRTSLGRAHLLAGDYDKALSAFDAILTQAPDDVVARAAKAEVLERRGAYDEGLALLEGTDATASDVSGHVAITHATLLLRTNRCDDADALLERTLNASPSPITRRRLLYVHGQVLDRLDRVDDAFAAFTEANALQTAPFSIDAVRTRFDEIRAVCSPDALPTYARATEASETPVFILSLPRSGSTLLEQIIDAHPNAVALGEITEFPARAAELPKELRRQTRYPDALRHLDRTTANRLAARYLGRLPRAARAATRATDKHLQNYVYAGLIALLLPNARIVHITRDPRDVALSCFMQPLSPVALPYSTSLPDLAAMITAYHELTAHWRDVLPSVDMRWLDVEYETLVASPETEIRRLIEFLDLDWNDGCLRFHETERDVATASYDQVRRPITTDAMKRWTRYAEHLGPVTAVFGDG